MVTAYLALGSNLGERGEILEGARQALDEVPGLAVLASSRLYQTDPVGGPEGQGAYLNAALRVETELSARQLLEACLRIENLFGRRRLETWGPRTLDLDLLFYGGRVIEEPDLIVPHPRLHLRSFVLAPLLDLDPDLVHPLLGRSIRELSSNLGAAQGVSLFAETW